MVDRGEERKARAYLNTVVRQAERELERFLVELEKVKGDYTAKKTEKEKLLGYRRRPQERTRTADPRSRPRRAGDRTEGRPLRRAAALVLSKPMAFLRGLPGIDIMPPTKIQQISLPELTINYNFKEVPRYDRCTTCHQGIDRHRLRQGRPRRGDGRRSSRSHPFLTTGATTIDPARQGGHGRALSRRQRSAPDQQLRLHDLPRRPGVGDRLHLRLAHARHARSRPKSGKKKHDWHEIHHWDYPMLPKRFIESSCLKCHHQVTDVPQAKKLQAGYQRIVKYGCTGCHTIGGEGSFGPDLTDERQVGPNLTHIASKDYQGLGAQVDHQSPRVPARFADAAVLRVTNNDGQEDWPKNYAEIHAITHYLFAKSTPPADFVDPPAKTDPAKGKELFLQKGCLACHQHRPYEPASIQVADRETANPAYKPDPAKTYDPKGFPAAVQEYAQADFGPNLSNIAAKFQSQPAGLKWLVQLDRSAREVPPQEPDAQPPALIQDAADIAGWILSVPARMARQGRRAAVDSREVKAAVDELVKLYVSKAAASRTPTASRSPCR